MATTRFQLFIKKWVKIYLKADMSEWSNVLGAYEAEYKHRSINDANFRLEYENSNELLIDLLMQAVINSRE